MEEYFSQRYNFNAVSDYVPIVFKNRTDCSKSQIKMELISIMNSACELLVNQGLPSVTICFSIIVITFNDFN